MIATTLTDRALLRLSGDDVRNFLQGLVTNDVTGALPVWAGLLTAQGKVLFDFLVWNDGADLLIDCEAEQADALARRLGLYRLRRAIGIERDDHLAVHWLPDGEQGVADPRLPELGRRWIAAPDASAAGSAAEQWRKHRLGLGVTEGVAELGSDKILWLEANAAELNGVSFSKGCYVGQENTARMNWRQKVNRRLVVQYVTSDPPPGAMAHYPALGLAVARLAVDRLQDDGAVTTILPPWLKAAIQVSEM